MKKTFFFCFFVLCCSIFAPPVLAGNSDIVISEIMIGQEGAPDNEYIKLSNNSDADITLDGFSLKKKTQSGSESALVSASKFKGSVKARGFFIIANPGYENFGSDLVYSGSSYYISADNTILLYDVSGGLIDKAGYGQAGDFEGAPAAGIGNDQILIRKNADGVFIDADDNQADFEIKITQMEVAQEQEAPVSTAPVAGVTAAEGDGRDVAQADYGGNIFISEILPNPKGGDSEGEFIELSNKGGEAVDLSGWRLADGGGYEYGLSGIIPANGFFPIYRKESRIALNNSRDEVRLLRPGKVKASQTAKYEDAKEGESFNFHKNKFIRNKIVTPGKENVINFSPIPDFYFPENILPGAPVIFDSSDTFDENGDKLEFGWDFGDGAKSGLENPEHTFWNDGDYKIRLTVDDGLEQAFIEKTIKIGDGKENVKKNKENVADKSSVVKKKEVRKDIADTPANNDKSPEVFMSDLEKAREIEPGDFVVTSGIVAAEPGRLGSQFFYIVDESGNGVQVYSNKKDFPELKIGDFVEVGGEVSKINGIETRIKTRANDDMEVIEFAGEPRPSEATADELEDMVGGLVRISGEIIKKSGQSVYIDDGTGEIMAYLHKGIDAKDLKAGDVVDMTGIIGSAKSGARVLPRSEKDIVKKTEDDNGDEERVVQIAGEKEENGLKIPARDKKKEFWKYFLTIMAGGLAIGGILYFRWWGK